MKDRQLLWYVVDGPEGREAVLRKRAPEGFVGGPFTEKADAEARARESWFRRMVRRFK